MMNLEAIIHRIGIVIGVVGLSAGFVLFVSPEISSAVPINFWVADLAALFAILLGLWVVRTRYRSSYDFLSIPNVEFPMTTPSPGHELDDLLYRLTELREGTIEYRQRIQERVAEIAIEVIVHRHDCSREEAIGQLESETWTDDEVAANFFVGGAASTGSTSLVDRLLDRFRTTTTEYERQLERTVEAIEEIGDVGSADEITEEDAPAAFQPEAIITDGDGERVTDHVRYRSLLRTNHWVGVTAFGFMALAVGILTTQPGLLLASGVAIGLAGYARVLSAPPLAALSVTRQVENDEPQPGEEIEVTVSVENTGDTILTDLKLIDRVPPMMQVVEGSVRIGTAIRPGGTVTFDYTVVAERGEHRWPLQAIGRDASGSVEREALIDTETVVSCTPRLKTAAEMPVRAQTSVYSGRVETKIGGEGLEFFSVRDYQPGDPKRRINWKSFAKTGNFSTIEFRKEHAARIVLLFDARSSAYVSPFPGQKHALDKSVDLAFDVYASLHDQGHLVGIAAFNGIPCWIGPNTGTLHLQRVRNLFTEHPALSPLPPAVSDEEEGRYIDPMIHIRRQLPKNTQIFLFSPMTDEYTYEVARRLDGSGHLVTVISPNPTTGRTIGQRIARLERAVLIKKLRDHAIRVIDWDDAHPMRVELEHAIRRWTT